MPLSFYPGKSDAELISYFEGGIILHIPRVHREEFDAWLNSPVVREHNSEMRSHYRFAIRNYRWGVGFAVWMLVHVLVASMWLIEAPSTTTEPNNFLARWLLIAAVVGVISPIKVKVWRFRVLYAGIVALLIMASGMF